MLDTKHSNDPMLDMFIFETTQLIEQLEASILSCEESSCFTQDAINEIFRIMHTIKGSSAMMMFENISSLAHAIEDLFYFLREEKPQKVDCSALSDLVFESVDFIKVEIEKIRNGDEADGPVSKLIENTRAFLAALKQENGHPADAKSKGTDAEGGDISEGADKDATGAGKTSANENEGKRAEKQQAAERQQEKQKYYISPDRAETGLAKNAFKAVIHFEEGCEMENIRAFSIIHNLKGKANEMFYIPEDIIENDDSVDVIRRDGFTVYLKTDLTYEKLYELLNQTIFLKSLQLVQMEEDEFDEVKQSISGAASKARTARRQDAEYMGPDGKAECKSPDEEYMLDSKYVPGSRNAPDGRYTRDNRYSPDTRYVPEGRDVQAALTQQNIISVSVLKLDKLMDLVGEMVIAEAMVVQNPDLKGLELSNFQKAARQLHKITGEIQDMVMSIRMVPVAATFQKMHRIVRDMCKKLGKEVRLNLVGEDTEVDKNIIEHISDPLMHLIRNSIDHGIEPPEDRLALGKPQAGTVTLEARNAGSDVLIIVRDDGRGLSKEKILKKARENGLLDKPESEMSDQEIYNLVLLPGFTTKDDISEYSGRGVGMDVVVRNIEAVGGSVSIESVEGGGSAVTLKIPLTLAIIDGMNIKVGNSRYTIPTISIKESFRPKESDLIKDPDGNEMIMVRGQCYPILRLHEYYGVKEAVTDLAQGILIMAEARDKVVCIFADELLGQQQVVVKALPNYIRNIRKIKGLTGCTLLGDGSISLILDVAELV